MITILFSLILTLTVSARHSVYEQAIRDPEAFAQVFSKVNPAQVQEIISIINGLIQDGQDQKDKLIADHEDAVAQRKSDEQLVEDNRGDYETAKGERLLADQEVARLSAILRSKQQAEEKASDEKVAAAAVLKDAQEWFNKESTRIDNERKTLEEVIEILKNLPKSLVEGTQLPSTILSPLAPSLIQAAKANPDAVGKVIELVKELIAEGEKVRKSVIDAVTAAQAKLDQKTDAWNVAVAATIAAEDSLKSAQADQSNKLSIENTAKDTWTASIEKLQDSQKLEDLLSKRRNKEVPVIDSEDKSFRRVIQILEGF